MANLPLGLLEKLDGWRHGRGLSDVQALKLIAEDLMVGSESVKFVGDKTVSLTAQDRVEIRKMGANPALIERMGEVRNFTDWKRLKNKLGVVAQA